MQNKYMQNRKILATTALAYANGDLHLGHVLEQIQADIWVRWQKALGHECWFISGVDAHGTPIMLKAKEQNISPEELVNKYYKRHIEDLHAFHIDFDNFYTTHSKENQELVNEIYNKLQKNSDIELVKINQLYDEIESMYLPDRYVKGQCPKCNAADQYGDNCECCGAHYTAFELKNPRSIITNSVPIHKSTEHYFFKLSKYQGFLNIWLRTNQTIAAELQHKLNEWLAIDGGLKSWDITRNAPYFGFLIPGTEDLYFYVWLDAPIGYLSIFKNLCNKNSQLNFEEYLTPSFTSKGSQKNNITHYSEHATELHNGNHSEHATELHHFIGKDIVYFHALFWPAILKGSGYRTPTKICTHGYLTINGEKMSKSRGTFITAKQYVKYLNAEYLRYYLSAKLSDGIEDLDLNFNDFVARINSDLVGKFVNIASRCAGFINKYFDNQLSSCLHQTEIYQEFVNKNMIIYKLFNDLQYSKAIREIMALADLANKYIDLYKPWQLIKDTAQFNIVQEICTTGLNLFRVLMFYLKPVLPITAKLVEEFLSTELILDNIFVPITNTKIKPFKPLIIRIEPQQIELMLDNNIYNTQDEVAIEQRNKKNNNTESPIVNKQHENIDDNMIDIEEFMKIDLRIAKILNAEEVAGSDKLLKLTLDVGALGIKQVFSGIKSAYSYKELIGKCTVIIANLKERKMRFGISQGMVLAASNADDVGDKKIWLLEPHVGAEPGMQVK